MKLLKCLSGLLFISTFSYAQLPQTVIWVFDMKPSTNGYAISNPTKIKVGNEYNNQPYFTQDGQSMYFVSNGKKGGKTDIYKYDFKKKKRNIEQLTKTKKEAEYSPRLTPDQSRISCVRVAADTVTQNFCTYDLNGKKPLILFPEIETFGYYCWRSQSELLSFHVPEPFNFMRHNIPYKKHDTLEVNIGHCLINVRGKILYVDKSDSTAWTIKILNNKRIGNRSYESFAPDKILSTTLTDQEDFALLRGKDLLMGKDGFIYVKKDIFTNSKASWEALFDLNAFKIYNFYRIAVSPTGNRLAVVAYIGDKP